MRELDFSKVDMILENTKLRLDVLAAEYRYPIEIKKTIEYVCSSCGGENSLRRMGSLGISGLSLLGQSLAQQDIDRYARSLACMGSLNRSHAMGLLSGLS